MYQYDFFLAGIPFRWNSEFPLELTEDHQIFRTEDIKEPAAIWDIRLGKPERSEEAEALLYEGKHCRVTENGEFCYRIFPYYVGGKKHEITLVRKIDDGRQYWLYLPKEAKEEFKKTRTWLFYMAFEEILYTRGRVLLHASYVDTGNGAILFSGPSGVGKSTQAALWERYENAVIQNGDKTLLYEDEGILIASGSPYAGSSRIYRNVQSRVCAIVILEHGEENKIRRLNGKEGLFPLYKESTFAYMTDEMRINQIELLQQVLKKIPVYLYQCKKDVSAVNVLKKELGFR